jgi:MFS family permease
MQGASIIGRPLLGWLSDQLGSATSILRGCAIASAATTALLAVVPADAPMLLWSISIAGGLTVSSWNGVHMARIAQAVPPDLVAESAAATNLIVFAGYIVGPALVMAVVELGGGYRAGMFGMAAATAAAWIPLRNVGEPQAGLVEAFVGPRPPSQP